MSLGVVVESYFMVLLKHQVIVKPRLRIYCSVHTGGGKHGLVFPTLSRMVYFSLENVLSPQNKRFLFCKRAVATSPFAPVIMGSSRGWKYMLFIGLIMVVGMVYIVYNA